MMTAAQAKVKTQERIKVLAAEFILNNVGVPLQDAIDTGAFRCSVYFEGNENLGAEVVSQLQEQGYTAEHVYYDNINGYANYISIKWGDD
jgi:hypothetical protein